MKTYHQNGTISDLEYITTDCVTFTIQHDDSNNHNVFIYPGDNLIQELDLKLVSLYDKFACIYFPDLEQYDNELSSLPMGLLLGGQNSDIIINKEQFLELTKRYAPYFENIYRYLYVGDCQYLVSTVQNLLLSAEYCYLQYYIKIAQIDCMDLDLGETLMISSHETTQLLFYLETFFTKLYSTLDLMVKIIYELEHPVESFLEITKLRSAEKLWGDRKKLRINKCEGTIFEDCEVLRMIESLRNEAVHNGTWEFRPKVFLKIEDKKIVERYMLFPDFVNGRLSSVINRKHFFSTKLKVNEMLVLIHDEFCQRFLATLQYIDQNMNCMDKQEVSL